ncbi:MAG: phage portal protein, partial [Alphaproteobacteria bacterium]|nr:phage portal protein [Alphaproteobacteria bacterium]
MERIRNAEKREDTWLKDAEAAETAYLCRTDEDASGHVPDFNILHSNVETIVPSIYNSTPVPDIRPRHNNTDPIGKTVADMLERTISAQIDDGRLDCEIEKAAQDAFVAGRGVVRIKLDADDAGEKVVFEVVSWKDYREGPAKRWSDVPWVAFRHTLSHEMLEKFSDQELVQVQASAENSEDGKGDVCIWEIWCRDTGHVYFIADDNNKVLKIEDDPLQLRGFFPMPEPVQPITGTSSRTPVCPYVVYKKLAEELDRQTRRINAIINGLKVKGIIAADAEGIEQLADADDNELIPIGNIENLVAAGGLDKAIMWWPLQTAIAVLKELYVQREQTKQTIYEITGISDIVRGASKSNETATAQQIKTEWGSLRIKKMQRMIERQVRDLFVLAAEIVAQLFSPQTIQAASGIPLSPEVMPLLQQPLNFYRIDVESDSTVRADATRNKQEMGEFLTGTANFFS